MAKLTISDAARVAGVARSTRMTAMGEPVVYVIAEHAHAPLCKTGFTTNLPKRLEALRTANPMLLQVIALWRMPSTQEARRIEREILQAYAMHRQRGEWFNIG